MILTSLEMQGFKSFPEKTVLTFDKGITAVVGPNGSGKSNISDAVRWVLGEQSSKSLRGSKMEDVIFDGTKIRKAHGYAQVTLRLDNKDRSIKGVDTDEVSVTRRYYRSGESEYKINGASVRLRDVHELFMDTGLGRDGYSMVSQGKIADMVSGKSKECREMFEEAAGISAYRYKRSDSIKKLNQAEENLVRLRDILLELEGRIGPLKTQSEKAQKFLVLAEEKKVIEIGLWLHNIDRLRDELRTQQDKLSLANSQYEDTESSLNEIEELIESCVTDTQNINIRIDEIRQGISELEEKCANAGSEEAVLRSSIEHNNDTIERITRDISDSESSRKELQREIDAEDKLIAQIKKIRSEKEAELKEANSELQKMQSEGGLIAEKASELSESITDYTRELSDSRVKQSTANSSMQEIRSRVEVIDQLIYGRQESVDALSQDKAQSEKKLSDCEKEIEELTISVKEKSAIHKEKDEKADKLKITLDEKAFEVQRVSSKIKMLRDLEKNMEGYSGAVKKVMKESEKGTLEGIHGTISQLITVKSEYAVAIETALGNSIQNIVTETEEDAKNAIYFLKKENAGRATFQPVSSVKGRDFEEKDLSKTEGYVGIADKLLSFDKKYSEIISSLLGKVVVCDNLDNAVLMAKKYSYSFKIVTLDGQVVNPGGSLTGGSGGKGTGILTRGTEIERLKEKEKLLSEEGMKLSKEYDELLIELNRLSGELEKEKQNLSFMGEEKIRLEGQLNLVLEQYLSAKSALDSLKEEKNNSDERIAEFEKTYNEAKEEGDSLTRKIAEAEAELSLLGEKRSELTQKREELSAKISRLNLDIHVGAKELSSRTEALNLLKARILSHEDRDRELDNEIEGIKEKNRQIEKEIEELRNLSVRLKEETQKSKEEIVSLQKKRGETDEKSASLRVKQRQKSDEREKISGEIARLEERKAVMVKDYDDTVNKLYDEYQLTKREAEAICEKPEEPRKAQQRLHELKNSIRALGSVNVSAIEEYKEVKERYEFMNEQVTDVERSKKELLNLIDELTDKMSTQFREQFIKINQNFGETFSELFGGGKAEIILEDPTDVLESNIDIKLQPPGKNVKRLDSLSGGEKGLSAIALLFAILKVNPAPFCIFDEVEAALDDVNVSRYAQYVKRMTDNTQFILITHRRGTMEEADVLYGITMQEQGVSKLLELKAAEMVKKLGLSE